MRINKIVILLFVIASTNILSAYIWVRRNVPGGASFTDVSYIKGTQYYALISENRWVYLRPSYGWYNGESTRVTTNAQYVLTGVSFAPESDSQYGWIVGYKNTEGEHYLEGAIWKTNDFGQTWNSQSYPDFPGTINVPFLDVHAVNRYVIWISCGYSYVLNTIDGGISWRITTKPGGPAHFGWLWGIWAYNQNVAWVCSDQSGMISYTINGGQTWADSFPFPEESLSYRHISVNPYDRGEAYIASSKGYIVYTDDWGESWDFNDCYLDSTHEWMNSVYCDPVNDDYWAVGTGGIIYNSDYDDLVWYGKYDLNAIDGCFIDAYEARSWIAVGTNSTILYANEEVESHQRRQRQPQLLQRLRVWDITNDHGWRDSLSWDSNNKLANRYYLHLDPPPSVDLRDDYEDSIMTFYNTNDTLWRYDTTSMVYNSLFTVVAVDTQPEPDDTLYVASRSGISFDNKAPNMINLSNISGTYDSILDAVVLQWHQPIQEDNEGGYWVCPVIEPAEENINHPAPLYRNCYIESIPANITRPFYWGFKVQAMDRSGNRGSWQPSYYFVYVPGRPTSPYATAFAQGKHLVRVPNTKDLHMVNETNHRIIYSYSLNEGETWIDTILADGLYPCIGINYNGLPWIAYCKDGDLICKIKRDDGTWKEILIFDGDETHWAGPPSMHLATMPIKEDVIDYAYITYSVYEGTIPESPCPQPPENIFKCYFDLYKLS